MRVNELIDKLQQCNPFAVVECEYLSYDNYDVEYDYKEVDCVEDFSDRVLLS